MACAEATAISFECEIHRSRTQGNTVSSDSAAFFTSNPKAVEKQRSAADLGTWNFFLGPSDTDFIYAQRENICEIANNSVYVPFKRQKLKIGLDLKIVLCSLRLATAQPYCGLSKS